MRIGEKPTTSRLKPAADSNEDDTRRFFVKSPAVPGGEDGRRRAADVESSLTSA